MTERDDTALDRAVDLTLPATPTGAPSPVPVGVDPTSTAVGRVDDPSTTEAGTAGVEGAELLRPDPAPADTTTPAGDQPAVADGTAGGDNDGSIVGVDTDTDTDDQDEPVRTIEVGEGLAPREALPDEHDPIELAPVDTSDGDDLPEPAEAAPIEDVTDDQDDAEQLGPLDDALLVEDVTREHGEVL